MTYPSSGFNHMFHTPSWRLKMKSALSQFSDLFSEFGKYIAPTYYHDRCERSVQMRLYTMHKREFVLVFTAFFASFGLCIFIGLAGPPITSTVELNATQLVPKLNMSQMTACEGFTVLHLGFLDFSRYIINVQFYGLQRIEENYNVHDVVFYFKSYNPSFTQIEIWFRLIFLILTFGVACWFAHSLRHFFFFDWSIEQKWMSVLLPLLLLYNDPVFPMSFLINSWLPGMLDAMFQATFLCSLLLFWLCIYHGIRQNERTILKFYIPKCIIVGLLWLAAFTLASWQKYNELRDPTYNYKVDTGHFMGFKVFFFTVGSVYLVYLLYLIIRAYTELRSMPYFDIRLKFLTALMIIVLSISIAITVLRFGVSVLQDNFVAELSTNYGSSVEFMSFYSLLNFYLVTMSYVYAPPRRAHFESRVKDNPTLSMINDSDEEVIYGSDSESHPLNPARKAQDKEESD